uniref:N-glycosylase/DNA lyase n=1 Tax=Graphocephala atropunctata TaxID=36148 RepID=A0A1B6MEG0_9HEMI
MLYFFGLIILTLTTTSHKQINNANVSEQESGQKERFPMKNLSSKTIQSHSFIEGSIICPAKELQLKPTLIGGQCFRWKQLLDESGSGECVKWRGVFKHHIWTLSQSSDQLLYKVLLNCPPKISKGQETSLNPNSNSQVKDAEYFENLLKDYFRLNENLESLYSYWSAQDPNFEESATKFYGIRMLKQDPVENIFSFICSTNNNIPRITSMVEKLCIFYGDKLGKLDGVEYYDFPNVSALAEKGVENKLRKESFGYRAKYLHQSATKIVDNGGELWLEKLQSLPYLEAKQQLMTLPGIGAKVADCISLMSLNHLEAIPVDTHVFQISQRYLPHLKDCKNVNDKVYNEIVNYFQNLYGKYAGWAHSVLFCADLRQFQSSTDKARNRKSQKGVKKRKLK